MSENGGVTWFLFGIGDGFWILVALGSLNPSSVPGIYLKVAPGVNVLICAAH